MIRSMTGYGKAQTTTDGRKFTVEIRSVNGKTADVSFKSSIIPRDMEASLRQRLIARLQRGNIDLFITTEQEEELTDVVFNATLINHYFSELSGIFARLEQEVRPSDLIAAILRIPEIRETRKKELPPEAWEQLSACIDSAADALDEFRQREGARLGADMLLHVNLIEKYLEQAEAHDPERIVLVRKKLEDRLASLNDAISIDTNRLEQELIYYLEKMDITEERVRLRQHCAYFRQTMETEPQAGRKLGFIAQEMGREINTLGSKASHAAMQQYVVKMKDELEKIKEQVLNVL